MKRTFLETKIFMKRWRELELDDDDLLELQEFILKNPDAGDIIQGAGGLSKLRFALPGTGKSGGIRANPRLTIKSVSSNVYKPFVYFGNSH